MDHLLLFIFLALLAEILGTVGGFGSSLFFVPIASYFLEFHAVLGITALFHVSSNLAKIIYFRQGVDKKILINMGIPAVLFVIIGAFVSKFIESEILEISLSLFLIAMSLLLLILRDFIIKPTTVNSIAGGVASGFIAGLVGTGGAIRGLALSAYNLPIQTFIATSAIIDLGVDSSRSIVYYANGYIKKDILYLVPILLIVSFVGTLLGKLILDRISEKQFKMLVLVLVFITGLVTLIKVLVAKY